MAGRSSTTTRLLVLGAVSLFEPVNGYQIRRELMSWEVDRWAHINPGSIYSMLTTLSKEGHVDQHQVRDGNRDVAVYTTTRAGRDELATLFASALGTVEVLDPLPLHTAVSMCPMFPREAVLTQLERRSDALGVHLAGLREKLATVRETAPPHVARTLELQVSVAEVERAWVGDLLEEIRGGGLAFAGEPADWRPDPEDPGWQMAADRERYRGLLRPDRPR
jgi:DNA-binding PadR family transcriptional regulator